MDERGKQYGFPSGNGTVRRLYEDNVFDLISDERFASLSADYEAESRKLKDRYNEIQAMLVCYARQSHDAKEFAALVEQ